MLKDKIYITCADMDIAYFKSQLKQQNAKSQKKHIMKKATKKPTKANGFCTQLVRRCILKQTEKAAFIQ